MALRPGLPSLLEVPRTAPAVEPSCIRPNKPCYSMTTSITRSWCSSWSIFNWPFMPAERSSHHFMVKSSAISTDLLVYLSVSLPLPVWVICSNSDLPKVRSCNECVHTSCFHSTLLCQPCLATAWVKARGTQMSLSCSLGILIQVCIFK